MKACSRIGWEIFFLGHRNECERIPFVQHQVLQEKGERERSDAGRSRGAWVERGVCQESSKDAILERSKGGANFCRGRG